MTMTVMSHMMRQAIRRFLVGEDGIAGSALIEFTLVAPLLVVMTVYTMDFGWFVYRQMQVQNAAQAGVDWAVANHVFNSADITAAVNRATNYTGITLPTGTLNPNPIERCGCPSTDASGNPTVAFTPDTAPNPCPTCTVNGATVAGGLYVTVQTQATWNSFIRYGLFSSATRTLTATATTRIQ
jgi:Flp pilus assembly protein TadG